MNVELIAILLTIAVLFAWNRAESRSDIRHMDNRLDAIRNLTSSIREESHQFRVQMFEEIKDFHNKLIEIERSRKN